MLLSNLGYEVTTCGKADEIVPSVQRERPDLLLQDLRMPGLDIERLVHQIRETPHGAKLPIVIFTASMESEEVGERVGAAAILDKPFRPQELDDAIRAALPVPA